MSRLPSMTVTLDSPSVYFFFLVASTRDGVSLMPVTVISSSALSANLESLTLYEKISVPISPVASASEAAVFAV